MTDSNIKEMARELTLEEQDQITGGSRDENIELHHAFGITGNFSVAAIYQMLYFRLGVVGPLSDRKDVKNTYTDYETGATYTHEEILEMIKNCEDEEW